MAVYERGYRPYTGGFDGAPAWWVITSTACRQILRTWSFRILAALFGGLFLIFAATLYVQIGMGELMERQMWRMQMGGDAPDLSALTLRFLRGSLMAYYILASSLAALTAMFAGSGLVADDVRTRSLALQIVRPISAASYAWGKAAVVPLLLIPCVWLPGQLLVLLAALWQPTGGTWEFLATHGDLSLTVLKVWLMASLGYGGLLLALSARARSRGPVMGIAAGVLFGGLVLYGLGFRMKGLMGEALRSASLIMNTLIDPIRGEAAHRSAQRIARTEAGLPDGTVAVILALAVFALGFYLTWRRARDVEVAS